MSNKYFPSHDHQFNAIIILWVNPFAFELIADRPWYKDGKILESDKKKVIVCENGWRVMYGVEARKRRGITNQPGPIREFERHARSIPGAKYINYYHKTTGVFSHRQPL